MKLPLEKLLVEEAGICIYGKDKPMVILSYDQTETPKGTEVTIHVGSNVYHFNKLGFPIKSILDD